MLSRKLIAPAVVSLLASRVTSFSTRSKSSALKMSDGLIDAANFAVEQSPASTKFVTNKMCPFAQKVWIALEVARAPYEMEEISLYGPNGKPDWFWDLNPDGTVPVLVCHGGAVVYPDSDLALDQIEAGKALGTGGFAVDTKDEKMMERVKSWRDSINAMLPVGKKAVLGGKKDELFKLLKEMDSKVEGPYLCGDKITSADCAAFPFLWRLDNEFGLKDFKNLREWLKTCNNEMSFKKTVQSAWWWWW